MAVRKVPSFSLFEAGLLILDPQLRCEIGKWLRDVHRSFVRAGVRSHIKDNYWLRTFHVVLQNNTRIFRAVNQPPYCVWRHCAECIGACDFLPLPRESTVFQVLPIDAMSLGA
jgi:hypothetical protein